MLVDRYFLEDVRVEDNVIMRPLSRSDPEQVSLGSSRSCVARTQFVFWIASSLLRRVFLLCDERAHLSWTFWRMQSRRRSMVVRG